MEISRLFVPHRNQCERCQMHLCREFKITIADPVSEHQIHFQGLLVVLPMHTIQVIWKPLKRYQKLCKVLLVKHDRYTVLKAVQVHYASP